MFYCFQRILQLFLFVVWPDDKPWCNSEIRRRTRKRDRLKTKAIKSGKISDWNSYKKVRNTVNNHKKQAKELFYNNLELSISDFQKNDRRKFWQVVRHFVKNENSSSATPTLVFYTTLWRETIPFFR